MGTFLQDLRFALRNLRKTPAFPLAAIATLALGIGATTAIFSTVNAVMLRPLPYAKPENLYALRTTLTDGRVTTGLLSAVEVARLKDLPSVEHTAALQQQDGTLLLDDGTPQHVFVYIVSDEFFDLFGLPMSLGAMSHEDVSQNAPPTIVISWRVWQDRFHGDPAAIGKPIRFAGNLVATISGVAPKNFDTPHNGDYWLRQPLNLQNLGHVYDAYMRVKPGVTLQRAESEMSTVMKGIERDFPASAKNRIYVVRPLVESIVGDLGPILIVVLSATALLLVLACVNVTNLLLARGAARAREMAVRVALGAGRGRIVRQLLTESVVLATAGAAVGLLVASLGVRLLMSVGASQLPRLDAIPFDTNVLTFALLALVLSGVLVGFAPALRLAGTDVRTLMNESGRSAGAGLGTGRWLSAMTVAEIALAVTLVAGAGWLIRSFESLRAINPGFDADRRVIFDVQLPGPFSGPDEVVAVMNDLADRLRALPGVVSAGTTSNFPLRGTIENSLFMAFKGEAMDPNRPMGTRQRIASLGFFDAMGIKLVSGRDFTIDDKRGNEPVAVVNRTFVQRYLPNRDPLGVQFASGYPDINPNSMVTIVGVVDDVRQKTLVEAAEPAYYSPAGQFPTPRSTFVVRTRSEATPALQASIRDEVHKVNPQIALEFQPVSDLVRSTLRRQELGMTLMLLFGGVAVALAAVGIYGVVAYAAAQRRNEVATRLALGASGGHVFWLVLRQGMVLAGIGTAIGLVIAYLSGRVVSNNIYAVQAFDPLILMSAMTIVVLIAVLATTIPAFRASRLDPSRVLRPE